MRVLFVTVPNKSHLYIAAPLAWAFRSAGHDVVIASEHELERDIDSTGLAGVLVGAPRETGITDQMNDAEPPAPPSTPPEVNPTQEDYARGSWAEEHASLVSHLYPVMSSDETIAGMADFARRWRPDLVVWDMLTYSGPLAAKAAGARHVRSLVATDGLGQLRETMTLRGELGDDDPLATWLAAKARMIGVDYSEDMLLGEATLDWMPEWTPQPESVEMLPYQHVPFNGPSTVPEWVHRASPDRRRICLTLGNSHREARRTEASSAALLEAVAELDVEVVATLSRDQHDGLVMPPNVRAVEYVPLNLLLPTCSVLVHHGGAGTFAGALQYGVPQLLIPSPWWSEKWYGPVAMGAGVEAEGFGRYVCDSNHLTADRLHTALSDLLADPLALSRAGAATEAYRQRPSPTELVESLRCHAER